MRLLTAIRSGQDETEIIHNAREIIKATEALVSSLFQLSSLQTCVPSSVTSHPSIIHVGIVYHLLSLCSDLLTLASVCSSVTH